MKLVFFLIVINALNVQSSFLSTISSSLYSRATKFLENDLNLFILSSSQVNEKFLPEVGNGHVSTQIKNKWIFLNGLYNGYRNFSHRACIPSPLNWIIQTKDTLITTVYNLNILIGLWKETFVYSDYNVSITTYASRDVRQILVTNISLETKQRNHSVILTVKSQFNRYSPDINFNERNIGDITFINGLTKSPENNYTKSLPIFMIFENVPKSMGLNSTHPWSSFITALDNNEIRTMKAFFQAYHNKPKLLYKHAKLWIETWEDGIIQVTSKSKFLIQSVLTAQYYILSSLPSKHWTNTDPTWVFYGISPGGLAHGDDVNDYMGHIFWDMDTWIFPAVLPFQRNSALEMMKYRLMMQNAALQHSRNTGYKGSRYPWESARTGFETAPSADCAKRELHVNADISYAVQQFLWTESKSNEAMYDLLGKTIIENIARFWASKVEFNSEKKSFVINDVIPPDEYVVSCNNSAFTNMAARISLEAPLRLAKRYKRNVSKEMTDLFQMAQHISYVTDENRKLILEHDTYKIDTIIKQADVVLLHYPLQINISKEYFLNNQKYYVKVTDVNGPAMTWSIYSINWFKLNEIAQAEKLFQKNFGYITLPFYVWSECINGQGAINFLTGMGGYLQNIINGFMGMRIELFDNGRLVFSPSTSTIISKINLHNLKYQGSSFDVNFDNAIIYLTLLNNVSINVYASKNSVTYILDKSNRKLVLQNQEFVITVV